MLEVRYITGLSTVLSELPLKHITAEVLNFVYWRFSTSLCGVISLLRSSRGLAHFRDLALLDLFDVQHIFIEVQPFFKVNLRLNILL